MEISQALGPLACPNFLVRVPHSKTDATGLSLGTTVHFLYVDSATPQSGPHGGCARSARS